MQILLDNVLNSESEQELQLVAVLEHVKHGALQAEGE